MRMEHPEQRLLPAQVLEVHVHTNAQQAKAGEQQHRQREPAQEIKETRITEWEYKH